MACISKKLIFLSDNGIFSQTIKSGINLFLNGIFTVNSKAFVS